jgi:hypothetical protein
VGVADLLTDIASRAGDIAMEELFRNGGSVTNGDRETRTRSNGIG